MRTYKRAPQAFSSRMPTLHQIEESNNLNAIDFESPLKNLLYGNEWYSEETNKIAFSAIQEFITL